MSISGTNPVNTGEKGHIHLAEPPQKSVIIRCYTLWVLIMRHEFCSNGDDMTSLTKPGRSGYTVVELLVVVGIIGMMAAAATPSFIKQIPNRRLDRAAWQVYMDLHQAQALAVSENVSVQVSFNTAQKQYTIWADANDNGAKDAGETEIKTLSDIAGLSLYTYPTSATFQPAGTVEAANGYYYFYVQIYVQNSGYKYVYAFPNGFIDGYRIQDKS